MRISSNQIFRQGLNNVLEQQERLLLAQRDLATGKKIHSPSDDPIAASQINLMKQRISFTERLQENRKAVENYLSIEEGVLDSVELNFQRLRELQVQSGNGSLPPSSRVSMANEAEILLEELVNLANYQDVNGHYIFSGYQTLSKTIVKDNSGVFTYNGDQGQRRVEIANGMTVRTNETAYDLFMEVPNGNGIFSVSDNGATNTGAGVISNGSVTDFSQYVSDDYTLRFANNSGGELVYLVSGANQGNILPPSGLADDAPVYSPGESINFNGIDIEVSGQPDAGDDFLIEPSVSESIFATVSRMISNLRRLPSTMTEKAVIQNENNRILAQMDLAMDNFAENRSNVGARLKLVDSAFIINEDFIISSKESLSMLEDADLAEAALKFNSQKVALEAAQKSYMQMQNLSLFNYLQ